MDTGNGLHFTVGSLRYTSRRAGGADFRSELGLVKSALLYADEVELVSVAASFMDSLDRLGKLPTLEQLALMRRLLPVVEPDASAREMNNVLGLIDTITGKLKRHRRLARDEVKLVGFLKRKWPEMEALVEKVFDEWGAHDFRVALRSGRLKLRPFAVTSPGALIDMGFAANAGDDYIESMADEAWEEYRAAIIEAVGDKNTYPLFDDLTGDDVVRQAVHSGIINPTPGAKRRSRHGGLSGDLLQRLPMFERANVSEVLDVRDELAEYLGAFREAVADSALTIESASWEGSQFAEEAELVFKEKVTPTVERIEQKVKGDRHLKELTYRYGPSVLGGVSSMGAFIAGEGALASLAALAAGLSVAATGREQRQKFEGERLYFYYRAGRSFRRNR